MAALGRRLCAASCTLTTIARDGNRWDSLTLSVAGPAIVRASMASIGSPPSHINIDQHVEQAKISRAERYHGKLHRRGRGESGCTQELAAHVEVEIGKPRVVPSKYGVRNLPL